MKPYRGRQVFSFFLFSAAFFLIGVGVVHSADDEKEEQEEGEARGLTPDYERPELPPRIYYPAGLPDIPRPRINPSVAEIQKELQEIVQIHRSLQQQHRAQMAEIQRITAEAKAHQALLKNLAVSQKKVSASPSAADVEESIRIEKLRLIQEKARENRAAIEEIQKKVIEEEQEEDEVRSSKEQSRKESTSGR